MANLAEVVEELDTVPMPGRYGPAPTIYARKPWTGDSEAAIWHGEQSVHADVEPELAYLLEVDLAIEAIEVWSEWRDGRTATLADAVGSVIWYAEHDAYQPLDDDLE